MLPSGQQDGLGSLRSAISQRFAAPEIQGLRDLDEAREFFARSGSEKVARDFDRVRPELELAALAFRLPPAFLACLVFQESKFDPRALSQAGAKGLMQLTALGESEIRNILKEGKKEGARPIHVQLHGDWNEYHRRRPQGSHSSRVSGIAGGSLLFSYYLSRLKNASGPLSSHDLLVASAAYNLGISKASRVCGGRRGRPCWEALIQLSDETRVHVERVSECMRRKPRDGGNSA